MMTGSDRAAVYHFPRFLAAVEARRPFMAGAPGWGARSKAEWDAAEEEYDAALAEMQPYICGLCGGEGNIDTRPDRDFLAAVNRTGVLGEIDVPATTTSGYCYRCGGDGWSDEGRQYARERGLLPPDHVSPPVAGDGSGTAEDEHGQADDDEHEPDPRQRRTTE